MKEVHDNNRSVKGNCLGYIKDSTEYTGFRSAALSSFSPFQMAFGKLEKIKSQPVPKPPNARSQYKNLPGEPCTSTDAPMASKLYWLIYYKYIESARKACVLSRFTQESCAGCLRLRRCYVPPHRLSPACLLSSLIPMTALYYGTDALTHTEGGLN
jgi:hypothetical protein